jgi:hypothetical protein
MTDEVSPHRTFSIVRVRALARTRMRRMVRTRIAIAAAVLAILPWAVVETPLLLGRLSALAEFSVVGLTVLGAGAIGDDLDNGEFAIAISHDVSPLEILVGNAAAALLFAALLTAAQLPLALRGMEAPAYTPIVLSAFVLVALLAGWLALMLLLATFLEGKGNAIAMIAVLFVPFAIQLGVLTRLPPAIALIVQHTVGLLPQVAQATALFGALLYRSPPPVFETAVLVASPFLFLVLAAYRLYRLEPAGRLTQ